MRVRVPASDEYDAVFVSRACDRSDQKLKYVYVIDQDNKAERDERLNLAVPWATDVLYVAD